MTNDRLAEIESALVGISGPVTLDADEARALVVAERRRRRGAEALDRRICELAGARDDSSPGAPFDEALLPTESM